MLFQGKRIIVVGLISIETGNLVQLFGVTLSLVATQRSRASELLWVVMYVLSGRNSCLFGRSIIGLKTKYAETFYFSFDCVQDQIFLLNVAKHWSAAPKALWTGKRAEQKASMTSNTQIRIYVNLYSGIYRKPKRVSQPRKERTLAKRTETYIAPMTEGECKWQYSHLFALRPFELKNSFQYYSWQKFLTALQMLLTKLKASTTRARWSKSERVRTEHLVLARKQVSLQTENEFVFHDSLKNTWTNHAADGPSIVVLFFVQLINEKWNFNYFPRRCHSLY